MERPTSRQGSPLYCIECEVSTDFERGSTSGLESTAIDMGSIERQWRGATADGRNTLALG